MKLQKFLKKPLWITLSSIFTIFFVALLVGGAIADSWKKTISDYLGVDTFRTEIIESDEEIDSEYYKSNYVKKDENGNIIYVTDKEKKYTHQVYDDAALRDAGNNLANQVQKEGTTILWNNATASSIQGLPLSTGAKISVFGESCVFMANSGRGSGNAKYPIAVDFDKCLENAGFSLNRTLWNFYNGSSDYSAAAHGKTGNCRYDYPYNKTFELPWTKYTSQVKNSFSSYNDAALIVLTRVSGEYEDCYQKNANTISGDYLGLSSTEKTMIEEVIKLKQNGTFKKVVLLLNTATSMRFRDLNPYQANIDSCVWIGQGGSQGLNEVGRILNGTSVPSGHLPDTFAFDGQSAPAAVNSKAIQYLNIPSKHGLDSDTNKWSKYMVYAEGIYVGYKYYETRYEDAVLGRYNASANTGVTSSSSNWKYSEEVAFPFGYGLSYTTFEYSDYNVVENSDGNYIASVKVTNTGTVAGKDAVQFYIQKPYTQYDRANSIEQAAINLCGFAKTKELTPNESVVVEVEIKDDAFKTYDANYMETYIREKGDYYIAVGHDSHDAINNILAMKGKTPANTSNVMDAEGNKDLVTKISFYTDDFETFTTSSTGYTIMNQFYDVDWNKSDYVSTFVKYLSRKDWDTTYPKQAQLRFHSDMLNVLSYDSRLIENPLDEMPLYNQEHQFNLIDMRGLEYKHEAWETLLNQLSLEDMVEMMGSAYHGNGPIESIASPGEIVYDGPLGVRPNFEVDPNINYYPLSFPIAPLLAATFNDKLANDVGEIKGEDILHSGINGVYGTGANIHRTCYGGRAYEYYSEDSYLSSIMCKEETIGIQKSGSIVNIKHFILNDQDDNRYGAAVWANEQSLREIYLETFRPAVEEGKATGIMTSFTRLGTNWSGEHYGLITEVLRNEWGFNGYVISDCPYLEYMNIVDGLAAGTDCILYELNANQKKAYYEAKDNATLAKLIRESTHRILYVIVNSNAMNGFTTNTRIIPVIGWWQWTIIGAQVGFGLLAAGSVTMLVLSFVLKKKSEEVTTEQQ